MALHSDAKGAAAPTGGTAGEAQALANLGALYWRQSKHADAGDHHRRALALLRQADDRAGEARCWNNLGLAYDRQGQHEQATTCYREALQLSRQVGDRHNGRTSWQAALTGYTELGCPEAQELRRKAPRVLTPAATRAPSACASRDVYRSPSRPTRTCTASDGSAGPVAKAWRSPWPSARAPDAADHRAGDRATDHGGEGTDRRRSAGAPAGAHPRRAGGPPPR